MIKSDYHLLSFSSRKSIIVGRHDGFEIKDKLSVRLECLAFLPLGKPGWIHQLLLTDWAMSTEWQINLTL